MKIYDYNGQTGELIGERDARVAPGREDWLDTDPTKFLVPANATTIAPPDAQAGMARVFDGTKWSLIEDHRGTPVWDENNVQSTVKTPGPIPTTVATSARPAGLFWSLDKNTGTWVQDTAAQAALDADIAKRETYRDATGADIIDKVNNMTAAQMDAYIDANVTNLAQARDFLKKLVRVMRLGYRQL